MLPRRLAWLAFVLLFLPFWFARGLWRFCYTVWAWLGVQAIVYPEEDRGDYESFWSLVWDGWNLSMLPPWPCVKADDARRKIHQQREEERKLAADMMKKLNAMLGPRTPKVPPKPQVTM